MKSVVYKGSIYINPEATALSELGLSAADVAGVMAASAAGDVAARRDELLAVAALRIAPLQDATDLGSATEAEAALLLSWKQYRVDLSRIEQQAGFPTVIDWPESPAQ